jgi:3-deoxy-7-phosphoheptulonate synthase
MVLDPMHGNTSPLERYKTRVRSYPDELHGAFAIHDAEGSYAGGVHVFDGQNVTECIGGAWVLARLPARRAPSTATHGSMHDLSSELAFEIAEAEAAPEQWC